MGKLHSQSTSVAKNSHGQSIYCNKRVSYEIEWSSTKIDDPYNLYHWLDMKGAHTAHTGAKKCLLRVLVYSCLPFSAQKVEIASLSSSQTQLKSGL